MTLGSDPEFFFEKKGKIIGAEKVLRYAMKNIIVDGVQGELNPPAYTCRAQMGGGMKEILSRLYAIVEQDPELKINWNTTVKIEKEELDTLSDKAKVFGCAPSMNADGETGSPTADASEYLYRSAGGHIHIGTSSGLPQLAMRDPLRLVNVLDILVGNTCVLIDRDPGSKKRREMYGRAGEFRLPTHGLEYRVLSNFWLQNYALMSFVMGMARSAVVVCGNSNADHDYAKELMNLVNMDDIRTAINENDYNLAKKNFRKIKKFIATYFTDKQYYWFPLVAGNLSKFELFAQKIHTSKKGLQYWFPGDPLDNWVHNYRYNLGWETFVSQVKKKYSSKKS